MFQIFKNSGAKFLKVGLIAVLVVGGFFVAAPFANAAILNVGTGQTYSTIQGAIDAAAQTGDTINVYPGNYNQDEANGFDPVTGLSGANNFNIFVNKSVTIQGVNASGVPITDYHNVAASVIAKRNLPTFGADAIYVQADNVAITGLDISGYNVSNNKTVEVSGDNFTFKYSKVHAIDQTASVYFNDNRYNAGSDISHIQTYRIEANLIDGGGQNGAAGVYIANGTGWSGPVSGRVITGNTITNNYDGVVFSGPGAFGWDLYPVGAATITGNSFDTSARRHVLAYGVYKGGLGYANADLDWHGILTSNTFDKAAITWTPGGIVRSWDSAPFINMRGIYSTIQKYAINKAVAGDTVQVLAGTYTENLTIDKSLTLIGVDDTTHIIGAVESTGDNVTLQNLKITNSDSGSFNYGVKATAGKALTLENVTVNVLYYGVRMTGGILTPGTAITINNSRIKGYAAIYLNGAGATNAVVTVFNTSLTGTTSYSGSTDDFATIAISNTSGVNVAFTGTSSVTNEFTGGALAKEHLILFINADAVAVTGTPTYPNAGNSTVNANALFVSGYGYYTNTVQGQVVARYVSDTTEFETALASAATTPIVVGRGDPAITTTAGTKTLNAGTTLLIEANNTPTTIAPGTTLVNNGTIIIESGATFTNNGTIGGTGTTVTPAGSSDSEFSGVDFGVPLGSTPGSTTSTIIIGTSVVETGNSSTTFSDGTIITSLDGSSFNLNDFVAQAGPVNSGLNQITTIQMGIPGITLLFSQPVTINIFVGASFDGQTLYILRSPDASSWTDVGLADKTCVVGSGSLGSGYCEFRTNEASYFTLQTSLAPAPTSNSGGGGGGGGGGVFNSLVNNPPVNNPPANPPINNPPANNSPTGRVLGAATFNFGHDLSLGINSSDVTELQKLLQSLGYFNNTATGYFGSITRRAVMAFQKANGVPSTGFVGSLTRGKLNNMALGTGGTSSTSSIQAQILVLQQQIQALLLQIQNQTH